MFRLVTAGFLAAALTYADVTKLPFTCKDEDIQWAGMSCSEESPCPIYLEWSGIATSGPKIFLSGNIHSSRATLFSIMAMSDDNGTTWREPVERVRGEELDHIQFISFETGWISGQRVAPLPGDPFLMITHDAGKTWRRVAVLAEGSPGFIQSFRFDSATSGKLIIDRGAGGGDELQYRLFESSSGGETWTTVESSATPIKNAPVPEHETAWRLRAEPGGKVLAVERRTGEKWTAAASFAIQIASCKGE